MAVFTRFQEKVPLIDLRAPPQAKRRYFNFQLASVHFDRSTKKKSGIFSLAKAYSAFYSCRQHFTRHGMQTKIWKLSTTEATLCCYGALLTSIVDFMKEEQNMSNYAWSCLRPGRARLDMYDAYHKNVRQNRLGRTRRNWLSSRDVSYQMALHGNKVIQWCMSDENKSNATID